MATANYITPDYTSGAEIKRVRKKFGMTQQDFALFIGSSKPTVERWETSDKPITGPIVLLLEMLERDENCLDELSVPEKTFPVRIWYMHKDKKCTLIDVDETKQIVRIKNYAKNIMFRAFGNNDNPTFEDYKEFLESRCFPATRDKMKLLLKDLDIPFYDPQLIIRKTEGRMAEDDFWLKVE